MEIKYYTKETKSDLLKKFLYISDDFKQYLNKENVYWIYQIKNLQNNNSYIGKTHDIIKRSEQYINEYCKGNIDRLINKALNDIGIENFILVPLEIALNPQSASIKEKYYIDKYDSINKGYNVTNGSTGAISGNKRPNKASTKQSLYAKMSKSKIICAVNEENNSIIFSTGLKLFGDYTNRHKDEIKSAAHRGTKINGYYIYYLNNMDFFTQLDHVKNKIEKNSIYKDNILQYHSYLKYANYIYKYILNNDNECNFTILAIVQSNDDINYKYISIEEFLNYYYTIPNGLK